ncbi:hypothetical protein [Hyphomicrobium sp. CS1GBMeth3]|uniref:hypothetical protein n=1 Tax=Hyphomicrobium sp. CS1GBMeth3 TaxID=1892845 RepID=UPI000930CF2A|nr:hypothetical protein [Hyphomicrobium sp. CS1GBMeth3]
MHRLTRILTRATRDIAPEYFRLNIDGGDPVYRERVYCYELYHRMRIRWPHDTDYRLNGEIDKAAHPILMQLGAAHAKPDFLVHRPGHMAGNHAIIEVKTFRAGNAEIRSDLEKLALFLNVVGYQRAIYLVFGEGADLQVLNRIANVANQIPNLPPVEVWLHQEAGTAARCAATLQAEPVALDAIG